LLKQRVASQQFLQQLRPWINTGYIVDTFQQKPGVAREASRRFIRAAHVH
jgi:hypothetical protein